jgi:gamma-glutamyltranspeptidase
VVTSDEPLASMAGMRILEEGGNAFDAAVATAIAVGVLDPRMSSIGGNGFATIYVAKTREVRALNFDGSAPKRGTAGLPRQGLYPRISVRTDTKPCIRHTENCRGQGLCNPGSSSRSMDS